MRVHVCVCVCVCVCVMFAIVLLCVNVHVCLVCYFFVIQHRILNVTFCPHLCFIEVCPICGLGKRAMQASCADPPGPNIFYGVIQSLMFSFMVYDSY